MYSRNIIGLSDTHSKWELNYTLITNSTEGIIAEGYPITTESVMGIKLSGNVWFDLNSKLECSIL